MALTSSFVSVVAINLIILWAGIQATLAEGLDGKGRLLTLILLLSVFANILANRHFRRHFLVAGSAISIWFLWVIYATLNTIFQYRPTFASPTYLFIAIEIMAPFLVMVIVASLKPNYVLLLLRWLQVSLLLFFFLLFIDAGFSGGRASFARFDPNELSLYVYALISIAAMNYFLGYQSILRTVFILFLALVFSILIGSRMGFVGCLILSMGLFFVTGSRFFSFGRFFVATPFVIILVFVVLAQTTLGERLLMTTSQADAESWKENPAEGTIFQYYGDRGLYYVLGWDAFKDAPVFGIGLKNFKDNYYPTHMHPELMVQIAELGIIGTVLYFFFMARIYAGLRERIIVCGENSAVFRYAMYLFATLLFSATSLFLYKSIAAALLLGLMLLVSRDDVSSYVGNGVKNGN